MPFEKDNAAPPQSAAQELLNNANLVAKRQDLLDHRGLGAKVRSVK